MKNNESVIPFPQADDMNKIIDILNVEEEMKLRNKFYMSKLLGDVHERQVAYYLSASMYLDIINTEKRFTQYALKLREMTLPKQEAEISMKIVSMPVFGDVFFMEKILDAKFQVEDVIEVMKDNGIEFQSEEMYKRRAQSVLGWVHWIDAITQYQK